MRRATFMLMALVAMVLSLTAMQASAQEVTLTMDEDPPGHVPVDGLSFEGVTFGFTVGGIGSTDATYDSGNGGNCTFTQDPVIEGDAAGTLTLDFLVPTPLLQFGVALNAANASLSPGFSVALFDASLNPIGTTSVAANPQPCGFPGGQFSHSGTPVRRAVITFNHSFSEGARFGFDNLTYISGSNAPIPTLTEWGMVLFVGLLVLGALRQIRRRQIV